MIRCSAEKIFSDFMLKYFASATLRMVWQTAFWMIRGHANSTCCA